MIGDFLLAASIRAPVTVPIEYANREIFVDVRAGSQSLHLDYSMRAMALQPY